ncbi:hypothetical protein L7F22_055581 [Adiantum nelumboides]|nr:hypothetical protein [Adiantum nelumboides]
MLTPSFLASLLLLLRLSSLAVAEVFFEERFDDDNWENRWVKSDYKAEEGLAGNWRHTAGTWSGDPDDTALPPKLPPSRAEDHRIELISGAEPPSQFPYRLSKALEGELETQIADLLRAGFIHPSSSPFAAPVLFVMKKDKSARLCVDYRASNRLTIKNKFPMPRIEYILERLDGAKFFTKIDLKSGYHQIRIFEADIPKIAFRTERGHYEFVIIPFGLTGAPGSFNKNMSCAFALLIGKCVFIFLDDILVFSATYEQHLLDVEKVLQILEDNQSYVNSKKSTFGVQEVSYLGFIISSDGIRLDPEKITAILSWEIPKTAQQIRSFVGLRQAYSRHMRNFSEIAAPLVGLKP